MPSHRGPRFRYCWPDTIVSSSSHTGTQPISSSANFHELTDGISYFFALMPDAPARLAMAAVGERFARSHRINAVPVGADDLHLDLCPVGRAEQLRQPLEDALRAAAGDVRAEGFDVTLDSAMRFSARDGQFPFVLCADPATTTAALQLRRAIAAAQSRVGLQVGGVSSFLPHVSLLHGPAIDPIEESLVPIQWRASDFALVRSFFGQSRFEVIGRWALADMAEPAPLNLLDELANMPDLADWSDDE